MRNIDSKSHVRGESIYLDDIQLVQGTLFACVFDSPVAHGNLKSIDIKEAENSEGVLLVITANDIKGENQIGGIGRNRRIGTKGREEDNCRDQRA
jgi:xanthine dehydrogenase large subunit